MYKKRLVLTALFALVLFTGVFAVEVQDTVKPESAPATKTEEKKDENGFPQQTIDALKSAWESFSNWMSGKKAEERKPAETKLNEVAPVKKEVGVESNPVVPGTSEQEKVSVGSEPVKTESDSQKVIESIKESFEKTEEQPKKDASVSTKKEDESSVKSLEPVMSTGNSAEKN